VTVAALPTFRRRVASADRLPSGCLRGRWSIRRELTQTVAALPTFRRRVASVDRPPSGCYVDGGRSAPNWPRRWPLCRHFVGVSRRQIDHRLGHHVDCGRSTTDQAPS